METPKCPTCGATMEPNPPRENNGTIEGCPKGTWGAPGDPAFVCLTDDKAHDDARKARADECRRLLDEADAIRKAQTVKREAARQVGTKEAAALAAVKE
jgi:hypothetical protein